MFVVYLTYLRLMSDSTRPVNPTVAVRDGANMNDVLKTIKDRYPNLKLPEYFVVKVNDILVTDFDVPIAGDQVEFS